MGYLLPWGQMSYWGAQVIINLFAAIPFVGPDLAMLIRGDFVVGDATLNRFFSLHVIAVPWSCWAGGGHIIALHEVGSNNPDGVEIKGPQEGPTASPGRHSFPPYYTVHDIVGVVGFLIVFYRRDLLHARVWRLLPEYNNFIPSRPVQDATSHCARCLVLHAVLLDAACHHRLDGQVS